MAKLFVATPQYGGLCTGYYTQSLMQLQNILRDNKVDMAASFLFYPATILTIVPPVLMKFLTLQTWSRESHSGRTA